jgi:hypothetical protein
MSAQPRSQSLGTRLMSAILDTFLISLMVVLVTSQLTGINRLKVFVADQILIGRCFKGFE